MKRSPLERRTPLQADPERTRAFEQRARQSRNAVCPVCGGSMTPGFPSRPRKSCGAPECVGELKSRGKRGELNPMKRRNLVERVQANLAQQRAALDAGLAPAIQICMRPGCDGRIGVGATMYCSPACSYADRARRGMRRSQAYHRCFVCGIVFAFDGNGHGKCCSAACASSLGSRTATIEVVAVIALRGGRRADFRDAAEWCRNGCGAPVAHQHHVVYRQHVEREGGDRWNPDDALGLCVDCHGMAHGHRRIQLAVLRDENFAFAAELLGPGRAYEYLRRRYHGEDPRLNALLEQWTAAQRPGQEAA